MSNHTPLSSSAEFLKALQTNLAGYGNPVQAHYLVAYSGGRDSTALLAAMAALAQTDAIKITAAYVDHGWRGNPPAELALLQQTCKQLGLPWVYIPANRSLPKTEAAARQYRYQQLASLAADLHAHAVLTAHHADDQIETLLFRLFRGTGLDGLTGIQPRLMLNGVAVLRPVLNIPQAQLHGYLREHGQQYHQPLRYFEDPSNRQTTQNRNYIRHTILPAVQKRFPQVRQAFGRLAEVLEGDRQLLEEAVEVVWQQVYTHGSLDHQRFNGLSRPMQRRVLRRFLAQLDGPLDTSFNTLEALLDFLAGVGRKNLFSARRSLGQNSLGHNVFLFLYKNRVSVMSTPTMTTPTTPAMLPSAAVSEIPVCVPGVIAFEATQSVLRIAPYRKPSKATASQSATSTVSESGYGSAGSWSYSSNRGGGRRGFRDGFRRGGKNALSTPEAETALLKSKNKPAEPAYPVSGHSLDISVDLSVFQHLPLVLRTRQPGDRIHPMGMPGPMRLKNFLINRGISRFERDRLPLLACGQNILWIPGIGVSQNILPGKAALGQHAPTHQLQWLPLTPDVDFDEVFIMPSPEEAIEEALSETLTEEEQEETTEEATETAKASSTSADSSEDEEDNDLVSPLESSMENTMGNTPGNVLDHNDLLET